MIPTARVRLPREDEQRLVEAVGRGDQVARTELFLATYWLVKFHADRVARTRSQHEELMLEGADGLLAAVDRAKPGFDARFHSYASVYVKTWIVRAALNDKLISEPVRALQRRSQLKQLLGKLSRDLGRRATPTEASAASGIPVAEVERLLTSALPHQSFDDVEFWRVPRSNEPDPSDVLEQHDERRHLRQLVKRLPERLRRIVSLTYGFENGEEHSQRQVSRKLGCSATWVGILLLKAHSILRSWMLGIPLPVESKMGRPRKDRP